MELRCFTFCRLTLKSTFKDYMHTKGDLLHFRAIGFAGVYTKGYSDSQPFTHNDKSEEILRGTATRQFSFCSSLADINKLSPKKRQRTDSDATENVNWTDD